MVSSQMASSRKPIQGKSSDASDGPQHHERTMGSLNAALVPTAVRNTDGTLDSSAANTLKSPGDQNIDIASSTAALMPPIVRSPPAHQRWPSHAPAISSPLNPNPPESIDTTLDIERKASDGSKPSSSRSKHKCLRNDSPRRTSRRPRSGVASRRVPELVISSASLQPMSVRDLGSDYTRYFYPFSVNRKRHSAGSSLLLPRSSSAALSSTLSLATNPFTTPRASTAEGQLAWPMIGDKEEDDDAMHMPQPGDEEMFRLRWQDHFGRNTIVSTLGLVMTIAGLLFVFIALPVLSLGGVIYYDSQYETPLDEMYNPYPEPEAWAVVNNRSYSLIRNIRTSLVDSDTPKGAMTRKDIHGDEMELVFSDEFNDNHRTFYEGDDPYWFAPDIWYGATMDLDWYDPDAVTTWDGTLELRLDKFPNHGVQFRSGMLNSWNQLCFKGGVSEVSISLPGPAAVMGLWPGAWTMGNLGRPGYLSTTEGLWPYTYDDCDAGITPNQSSYDGLSRLPGQRLPSCTCKGEDHPTPGRGRGAPEIDIIEAGASYGGLPIATQSYQVAPFDVWYFPDYNFTMFPDYRISYTNTYTGGPFQQALSATTNLNKEWYDDNAYQKYAFEYVPGDGEAAYIAWFVGDQMTWMLDGRAIGPNGNIKSRQISQEPMSLILNLGISTAWTAIDWQHLVFPTIMRVDYVRWYQKKGNHSITCDPPGWETTEYIKDHLNAYTNPNLTKWEETGFSWPKHKLNSDC